LLARKSVGCKENRTNSGKTGAAKPHRSAGSAIYAFSNEPVTASPDLVFFWYTNRYTWISTSQFTAHCFPAFEYRLSAGRRASGGAVRSPNPDLRTPGTLLCFSLHKFALWV